MNKVYYAIQQGNKYYSVIFGGFDTFWPDCLFETYEQARDYYASLSLYYPPDMKIVQFNLYLAGEVNTKKLAPFEDYP